MALFFCIISLLLVVFAPNEYSYWYCYVMHWFYVGMAIWGIFKNKADGFINFLSLFSIAYWAVFFIYPIFVYPYRPYIGLFAYDFDESLITYSTAVAVSAYSFFLYGYQKFNAKRLKKKSLITGPLQKLEWTFMIKNMSITIIILFVLFLSTGGLDYFSLQYQEGTQAVSKQFGLTGYIYILLQTIALSLVAILLCRGAVRINFNSIFSIGCIALVSIMILLTGFRTFPAMIAIMTIAIYNDKIKRIGIINALMIIVLGCFVMTVINIARHETMDAAALKLASNATSDYEYVDFLSDFYINNRSLYSLIGFTIEHGYTYGLTLLSGFLGVVPFLVGLFCSFTGIHSDFLGSAQFNSFITLGHVRNLGVGTNAVADIYLAFGFLGVLVIFYLFGKVVAMIRYKGQNNIYYLVAYYILQGRAMYTCRSGIFMNLQPVLWSVAVIYIYHKLYVLTKRRTV